ncbi:hypothetical protein ADUPG1_007014, partial [Aduncisulcus paluster]
MDETQKWQKLNLSKPLEISLEKKFPNPTRIQSLVIPSVLQDRRDIIGLSPTGSGKTLAYIIPMVELISESLAYQRPTHKHIDIKGLIIVPTRELGQQIEREIHKLSLPNIPFSSKGWARPLSVICASGGKSINEHISALSGGCHILIATPGRLIDLVDRRPDLCNLLSLKIVVVDEIDKMVDKRFISQLEKCFSFIPSQDESQFDEIVEKISLEKEKLAMDKTQTKDTGINVNKRYVKRKKSSKFKDKLKRSRQISIPSRISIPQIPNTSSLKGGEIELGKRRTIDSHLDGKQYPAIYTSSSSTILNPPDVPSITTSSDTWDDFIGGASGKHTQSDDDEDSEDVDEKLPHVLFKRCIHMVFSATLPPSLLPSLPMCIHKPLSYNSIWCERESARDAEDSEDVDEKLPHVLFKRCIHMVFSATLPPSLLPSLPMCIHKPLSYNVKSAGSASTSVSVDVAQYLHVFPRASGVKERVRVMLNILNRKWEGHIFHEDPSVTQKDEDVAEFYQEAMEKEQEEEKGGEERLEGEKEFL